MGGEGVGEILVPLVFGDKFGPGQHAVGVQFGEALQGFTVFPRIGVEESEGIDAGVSPGPGEETGGIKAGFFAKSAADAFDAVLRGRGGGRVEVDLAPFPEEGGKVFVVFFEFEKGGPAEGIERRPAGQQDAGEGMFLAA